jgi:signal transduction histidine kinase
MVSRERAFSADASHQLRTPLAALRIELEAAQLRGERPDPAVALRQVERLEQTIATLLAVARDRPAGTNEADLVSIAERLESEWRPRLADDGRRLSLEFGAEALAADAHAGVVQEVLGVLLDNAARHGAGTVTLSLRARDGWAQVDVTDEGAGFGADPESALERGNSRNGHGIGLALARSLADAEGGRLTIADPGPRPTVRLLLRLAAARMG